jgi:lipoprotein-releasing system permease protein
MPLTEAQAYFNRDGEVDVIEVFVDNPDRIDACAQAHRRDRCGGRGPI